MRGYLKSVFLTSNYYHYLILVKLKTQNLVPRIRMRGALPPPALRLYGVVLIRLRGYIGKNLIVVLANMIFNKPGKCETKKWFILVSLN